jgi:hypothetical protein
MSCSADRERAGAGRCRARQMLARRSHVCVSCRERRSLFRYRGVVRADRDHTLCFQCYRALRDSVRAHTIAQAA